MKNKTPSSKSNRKMGKGLSSLFDKAELNDILSNKPNKLMSDNYKSRIENIPINEIKPNPNQPRTFFNDEKLKELAESIKHVGIIEPIIVIKTENNYKLIAGERRLRAGKIAGFKTIPAVVKNDTPKNILEIMLIENIQREDLSPLEEAESYQVILSERKITQEELAARIGKSRSHITNIIRTLKLPPLAKKYLADGKLSLGQAKILLSREDILNEALIDFVVKKKLSIKAIEKLINSKSNKNPIKKNSQLIDPNIAEIEAQFREKLKTKVSLHDLKNKIGRIEIEYYSYNDLMNILNKIN